LYSDANIAARAGRAVAMDELEQGRFLLPREMDFAVKPLQSFVD